jgi:predicted Zn-dependent protease
MQPQHPSSLLIVLIAAVAVSGCVRNVATGERQLSFISQAQEVQIGQDAARDVRQSIGLVDDPELQAYVGRIGQELAKRSERPDLPWSFQVVDDPSPNAFALPGGPIFITRGMLGLMTSEAELASVLGHEIGHVTARHAVSQISQQQLAQIGLGLGAVFSPTVQQLSGAIGSGLGLLFLKYSRDDERQADELGFAYASRGGYDTSEFADVFVALGRVSGAQGSALPGWLSSHPTSQERVDTARARASANPAAQNARSGRDDFLRRIDGMVYGTNPRNGFFRDDVFFHPELQFQMRFPSGWQHQNMTQAVVGASPDGAAAIELTLADARDPEDGLKRFAGQSGVQVGPASRRTVSGLPAIGAEFSADTQQGPLRGLAVFVAHRERVYRLIGYAAASRAGTHAPAISAAIDSFGPVRDRAVLSVMPDRIAIARLDRAQTLAEFAKRFPSAVDVEHLAAINHVATASTRLEAGTTVKRVVAQGG